MVVECEASTCCLVILERNHYEIAILLHNYRSHCSVVCLSQCILLSVMRVVISVSVIVAKGKVNELIY